MNGATLKRVIRMPLMVPTKVPTAIAHTITTHAEG